MKPGKHEQYVIHTGKGIRLTLRFVLKERKKEQKGERMKVFCAAVSKSARRAEGFCAAARYDDKHTGSCCIGSRHWGSCTSESAERGGNDNRIHHGPECSRETLSC